MTVFMNALLSLYSCAHGWNFKYSWNMSNTICNLVKYLLYFLFPLYNTMWFHRTDDVTCQNTEQKSLLECHLHYYLIALHKMLGKNTLFDNFSGEMFCEIVSLNKHNFGIFVSIFEKFLFIIRVLFCIG